MANKLGHSKDGKYFFECPGCGNCHWFTTEGVPKWAWNGDREKPTLSPSLLVSPDDERYRCHSFVENGFIRYLQDCHHAMKGMTVEIQDWN